MATFSFRVTTNGEQLLIKALSGVWPMSYSLIQVFNELFLKIELNGWTSELMELSMIR